jgi:hypothetical protein
MSADMSKGIRWDDEISKKLEMTAFGIICLTRSNLGKPWILFEAGAISKKRTKARVWTLLVGLEDQEIEPPLGLFQHTRANKSDVRKLVDSINEALGASGGKSVSAKILDDAFEREWPRLAETFDQANGLEDSPPPKARGVGDLLADVLGTVRAQQNELVQLRADFRCWQLELYQSILAPRLQDLQVNWHSWPWRMSSGEDDRTRMPRWLSVDLASLPEPKVDSILRLLGGEVIGSIPGEPGGPKLKGE